MAWSGEVPLLGFDDEHYDMGWLSHTKFVLYVPVPNYNSISIYAWSGQNEEGYNIFFPSECPVPSITMQAKDPFMVKMIVTDYLRRYNHFLKTGELLDVNEVQGIPARPEAGKGLG